MTVEALNCPNCGAGVVSDSTECEFCKTRLKTMACPSCFGLMFIGTEFCGHCSKKMVIAAASEADLGNCPRCKLRLDLLQIGETKFRECHKCNGLWSDVETFEHLCSTAEQQSAVLGFMAERNQNAEPPASISYVPCPDCKQLMNRSNFARASGVIIDTCKKHGIWFDADELSKIIEFIQRGGMELARKRELFAIETEREKLRDEQRGMSIDSPRFDLAGAFNREDKLTIAAFVRSLFD
ncbi:hypothetical protein BH10ACI2_BH10ACI2_20800 [soil metagenome]